MCKSAMVNEIDQNGIRLEQLIEYGTKEAVIQNLRDAGCGQDTIECCIACLDSGKKAELLERLENHRKGLLRKVHEGEKQIDCLDYLVYQIDRCRNENKMEGINDESD